MTSSKPELDGTATKTPHVQEVVALLIDRALATADVTTSTLKLAASEARLAVSSAGMLAGFLIVLVIMVPITWLVALATAFAALKAAGLSELSSLSLLLALQLLVCALIGWTILRLTRLMAFKRTREALRTSLNDFDNKQLQPTEDR